MATYRWHEDDFIRDVASRRSLRVDGNAGSRWRMSASDPALSWSITLSPASGETPPEIVWRTTDLRAGDDPQRQLVVRRRRDSDGSAWAGAGDDAVSLVATGVALAIGGLFGRRKKQAAAEAPSAAAPPAAHPAATQHAGPLGEGWSVTDPGGVLDTGLAPLFSTWPVAWWGPGDERPATLDALWLNQNGLEVTAAGWWCSADALDQLITVGTTLGSRARARGL